MAIILYRLQRSNQLNQDLQDIRPVYDEEPMAEGQLTIECNIFAIGQQHTEQPEIIVEGRGDQYPETCQVKSPMLDSSPDNQTTKYSRMKAHCIALELKYQNQSLKSGQHGQILNETSNKAKIEKEIDVLETMNIELEHSMAKLHKENKTLKKHYKYLYDSIKITRSKTIEQTTSLLANNAALKAQIQEKVFAIAALKNDLRKLKGNSMDTKFAKTSVLGKPMLQSLRNQSVVRQPNAFKSERPQMSKPRFASQIDVTICQDQNSSKNMPRFSSNDMVHNHYLDEARKKTQERDRNSKTSMMPYARFQSTADDSKPKPRSLPADLTGHRFSPNKTSAVYEKTSPRSDLRWKSTGRIFKSIGLRWIPTGKLFDSCTSKVDNEPTHGSNVDIPNIHECKQTLDVSAEKSQSMVDEKDDISETIVKVDSQMMIKKNDVLIQQFKPLFTMSTEVPTSNMIIMTLMPELESLFGPLFDEYFNGENQVISKSLAVTTVDAFDKHQQQPDSTSSTSTLATTVTADGNFDL
ncbi:hypothetical protein Tco_0464393 [Tanacetum coccineum]